MSVSLIEEAESTPRGAQEMAAARLALSVTAVLDEAMQRSGLPQRELAERLGLTEGAVSQVLNGDGNLRIATVGRYLRAAGFQCQLALERVSESVLSPDVDEPRLPISGTMYTYLRSSRAIPTGQWSAVENLWGLYSAETDGEIRPRGRVQARTRRRSTARVNA